MLHSFNSRSRRNRAAAWVEIDEWECHCWHNWDLYHRSQFCGSEWCGCLDCEVDDLWDLPDSFWLDPAWTPERDDWEPKLDALIYRRTVWERLNDTGF